MLLTERAVVGRDANAIVGLGAGLDLVDQVANGECVLLVCAKDQRLLSLIDGYP